MAFQALYAWDMAGDKKTALDDLTHFSWAEPERESHSAEKEARADAEGPADEIFSRLLVTGTVENIEAVDTMIRSHLLHWDFSRLGNVDRALLRLSVYELLFQTTPPSVVIDEAVDVSREYGTDDSYRFINGVLDGVRKTIEHTKKEREP